MPTNKATAMLAEAVPNAAHVVQQVDTTWNAYTRAELSLIPRHARTSMTFLVVGQSNAEYGRWFPYLSPSIVTLTGRPVTFLNAGVSSTSQAQWQPGQALYNNAVALARAAGNYASMALWWQGESEAGVPSITQAQFKTNFDAIAAGFMADLGIKTMPCKLETIDLAGYDVTPMNLAYAEAWATNPNVWAGPDFVDITPADHFHPNGATQLTTIGSRWYDAILATGRLS